MLGIFACAPAKAQILYGGLVGEVRDPANAAIPAAKVAITNSLTGVTRNTETNTSGFYSLPTISTGQYALTVEARGFRTFVKTGIMVTVNNVTRADVTMEIGQVTQQLTVAANVAVLQTDRAEVRADVGKNELENVPIPLGRNYQMVLGTIPGFSPAANSSSLPSNPSRSVTYSVNGTSAQTNSVRIDGVSSYNPDIIALTGLNPTLEAVEVVNVVTNSFDAEQGLAGGVAINLQVKSGTNQLRGSAFWYHNDQHLSAYPFFSNRKEAKPKFIYNQAGGSIGGPFKKSKAFFFLSYERTAESSNVQKFLTVPTAAMRRGDLSASPIPVHDPMTGKPFDPKSASSYAGDRQPFPDKQVPLSRFSRPSAKILDLGAWPLPNSPGRGSLGLTGNYLASTKYASHRDQIDSKTNFYLTDRWTAFVRLSYLTYNQFNPAPFGMLGGPAVHPTNSRHGFGFGPTYSGTVSATYTASPNLVFDSYVGVMLNDTNAGPDFMDKNVGRDILGIPGTNGTEQFQGGMVRMPMEGFDYLGYSQVTPLFASDYQYQYVFNGNWSKGRHEIRFGPDLYFTHLNHKRANPPGAQGGPPGGFQFRSATTTLRGGPAGNEYNSITSFLLGLPRETGRSVMSVDQLRVRTRVYSVYVRDRWNVSPKLTMSYGVRWEFFPFPTRAERGLERYDPGTNEILVCGVGSIPKDCGNKQSNRLFAPRLGLAYRATDTLVVRAGYGLTYDPFNVGRDLEGTYPSIFAQNVPYDDTRSWSTTLERGLPAVAAAPTGERLPMPLTAAIYAVDRNYKRGYVQSWNLTLEREFGKWIASAGYVATRSVRQSAQLDINWSDLGAGNQGRQLFKTFGRSASTTILGALGTPKYDALQTRLTRRSSGGYQIGLSYTWAHSRGYTEEGSFVAPRVNHPAFWRKNYGPTPLDIRHNVGITGVFELPFGRGKRWAQSAAPAAILGGWQVNTLAAMYTGPPVTPTAPGTVLNTPGSGQYADCLAPVRKIGSIDGWWDRSSLANPDTVDPRTPRFGTCGAGALRGPGLINVDFGVFRKFQFNERVSMQFRAEAFNVANTPHFANPVADVASASFGVVSAVRNTGREGNDQRFFRLGLRLAF